MSNEVRDNRLAFELEEMQRLCRESSLVRFQANEEYLPDQYFVEFHCVGLAKKECRSQVHVVHIYLPVEYPRMPPVIRFKTPIFHPNIRAIMDDSQEIARIANAVGGLGNLERLYHENPTVRELFDAHICLDVLQLSWTPAYTLYDICLELGAMIQYQRFNTGDPLNKEAAEWAKWAQTQPGMLPIDSRDLRDRLPAATVKKPDVGSIRILKVEKVVR